MKKVLKLKVFTLLAAAALACILYIQPAHAAHDHTVTTKTTKATTSKNGKVVEQCSECGKVLSSKTIRKIKTVKLSQTSYTYTRKAKKPKVIVKDSAGKTIGTKYYTVKYQSGRTKVGYYKVTVKFKGRYSGSKTLWFKIKPQKTSITSVKTIENGFTVRYKKGNSSQISGYQVQYFRYVDFRDAVTKTITGKIKTSKTVKGLWPNTPYGVRVRTYTDVKKSGKTVRIYSAWSKKEIITTDYDHTKPQLCYVMLDYVNEERAKHGLDPMVWASELEKGTLIRAKELGEYFSHDRPNGETCFTAWSYCVGPCAENIGDGLTWTPLGALHAWLNSTTGHREVILSKSVVPDEICEEDSDFVEEDGTITHYDKGDIMLGGHNEMEMCCAFYDGYWIFVIRIGEWIPNVIK